GIFYQALTQYLGFPHYGDEYKVMGLAPYGRPERLAQMRKIVKLEGGGRFATDMQFFRHHREKIDYAWDGGSPHVGRLYSEELEELLGPARRPEEPLEQRHRDLAHSVQAMYEEAFFHIINHLHERNPIQSLALAGGCAMNSVANGKVFRKTPFRRLYVQSAAGDAGGAIGAAAFAWHKSRAAGERSGAFHSQENSVLKGDTLQERYVMDHAYLGPSASDAEVENLLDQRQGEIVRNGCQFDHISDERRLYRLTAEAI